MWSSNQLMNFCDPVFKTDVTCNTVCCEGYEVTNLVSEDVQKRKSGFLSDRFIKPPVDVSLKFPFEISLSHVQIVTEVGQQKSSAVEVVSSFSNCSPRLSPVGSAIRHRPDGTGQNLTECVGFVNIENTESGVIFFCPQLHGRKWTHSKPRMKQKAFTWVGRGAITHTSKLTIRIIKTSGSSVPALGSIEVWGVPSSCIRSYKLNEIKKLWKSTQEKLKPKSSGDGVHKDLITLVSSKPKDTDACLVDQVPEDFLDAITYEIMSLPMVLPSGKIVDQETLDRHAAAEANWGRLPCDPFTGILFRSGCQPVLDVALKGRIDRFLVLNQNHVDLKMVPRTVGRLHQTAISKHSLPCTFIPGISSLVNSNQKIGAKRQSENSYVSTVCSFSAFTDVPQPTLAKEVDTTIEGNACKRLKTDEGIFKQSFYKLIEGQGDNDDIQCLSSPIKSQKVSSTLQVKSHDDQIDESLQFAVKAALSGLPSFVNPVVPKIVSKECGSCKCGRNLFSLPCRHFLCRNCLVLMTKQNNQSCPICHVSFKSSDPVRYHETSVESSK